MELESQSQVKKFGIFAILGAFIILFIGRVLLGSGSSFLNVDELELIRSTSDRLLGVPQTSLAWPGTTIQMILVPFVFLFAGVSVLSARSSAGLADFLADFIYGTEDYTIFFRFILLAVMAFVCIRLLMLQKSNENVLAVGGAFLVLLASPIFVYQSALVTGDALASVLMLVSLILLLSHSFDQKSCIFAAIAFGAAIGCRATFVLYIPVFAYLLYSGSKGSELKVNKMLLLFAGITFLSVLFFLPAIWIDPVRVAKSILGNAGRAGEPFNLFDRLGGSVVQIGIWNFVLAIYAATKISNSDRGKVYFLVVYSVLLLILISRLGILYNRYYLMILPPFGVVVMLWIRHVSSNTSLRVLQSFAVGGLFVLFGVAGVISYSDRDILGRFGSAEPLLRELSSGTVVKLDVLLANEVDMRIFDRQSLLGAIASIESGSKSSVLANRLGSKSGRDTVGLPFAFIEDELSLAARLRVLAHSGRTGSVAFSFYGVGIFSERYGVTMMEDVPKGVIVVTPSSSLVSENSANDSKVLTLSGEVTIRRND